MFADFKQLVNEFISRISKKNIVYLFLCVVFMILLVKLIQSQTVSNTFWLEGTWKIDNAEYVLKPKDVEGHIWDIKKDGRFKVKNAELSISSNKNLIILVKPTDSKEVEYQFRREKNGISLNIVENKK